MDVKIQGKTQGIGTFKMKNRFKNNFWNLIRILAKIDETEVETTSEQEEVFFQKIISTIEEGCYPLSPPVKDFLINALKIVYEDGYHCGVGEIVRAYKYYEIKSR